MTDDRCSDGGTDGIAVVGMAGRFPGARDVGEFWSNLRDGVESISFFSDEELVAAGVSPEVFGHPDYVRAGAEVEGVDLFDAEFFGYTAREAQIMDPQHRLFLETAWEALEHAGYDAEQYPGRIGVFAGAGSNGYLRHVYSNPQVVDSMGRTQVLIGNELGFLTARVSYKLNLRGPSVSIRTACSTSLVAVHMACQSLRDGQCEIALCGGVHINTEQSEGYLYQEGSFVSPDGHCRPFDGGALGTVFGSGVGVVVVKRLADALDDGDSVYAVIRGSAINNDGSVKASFTAPSVGGQSAVVVEALWAAGVAASSVGYVEAHGTGTSLGDPIEVEALTRAYRRAGGSGVGWCALGSVKSNIGHLDAAAGIAGLVKTVLALHHGMLPPSLNFVSPNPEIDFGSSPFRVVDRLEPWVASGGPRRAGVSAFGFGGTNAHVIVQEAPAAVAGSGSGRGSQLMVLSARSAQELESVSDRLAESLRRDEPVLADAAFTLARGRRAFPFRRVVGGPDVGSVAAALEQRDPARVLSGHTTSESGVVGFLFSGQGSQFPGMGWQPYAREPVFTAAVDECLAVLARELAAELRELVFSDPAGVADAVTAARRLSRTELAQPALFVVEYALARLWASWGVGPSAVLGHSLGEYAAACVAGVFEMADAVRLVVLRGRLMQRLPAGSMVSVVADRDTVSALLGQELSQGLSLAAHNGPKDCVVSGPAELVAAFAEIAHARGLIASPVATSHAFHSVMMEPILAEFEAAVAAVPTRAPQLPIVSNVTGTWMTDQQAQDPGYWAGHLRAGVEFATGVAQLATDPNLALVEIGPGHTLSSLARRITSGHTPRLITPSLPHQRDRRDGLETIQRALGQLWIAGTPIDWTTYYQHEQRRRIPLPSYPFQRRRYWLDPYHGAAQQAVEPGSDPHPLLDQMVVRTMGQAIFRTEFDLERHWVLSEHKLLDQAIVPGTTYLEMARAAAGIVADRPVREIREVDFLVPMLVLEGTPKVAHTTIRELDDGQFEFTVVSHDPEAGVDREWTVHVRGWLSVLPLEEPACHDVDELRARCQLATVDVGGRQADHEVMAFGHRWQGSLQTVHVGVQAAIGRLRLPDQYAGEEMSHPLHPALLDLATGFSGLAILDPGIQTELAAPGSHLFLPLGYDSLRIHGPIPAEGYAFVTPHPGFTQTTEVRKTDVVIVDDHGDVRVEITGFTNKRVADPRRTVKEWRQRSRHHTIRWAPAARRPGEQALPPNVLLISRRSECAQQMMKALRHHGVRVVEAEIGTEWERCADDRFRITPTEVGYERLLRGLGSQLPDQVVYLAGGAARGTYPNADLLVEALSEVNGLFAFAKTVAAHSAQPSALTVVAPLAGQVTGTEPELSPLHAALFGLAKVIDLENEGLRCRCIDVDGSPDVDELVAELVAPDQQGLVAFRDGRRYLAELTSVNLLDRPGTPIGEDGVYLITGGLGGLGLEVARHLGRTRPSARVALVSRGALPAREGWEDVLRDPQSKHARQVAAIRELEASGLTVRCYSGDVADEADVRRVVSSVRSDLGRIDCIVHAAGVAGDGFILRKDAEVFRRTLAPKVLGATLLDIVTSDDPPELMVLFSSTTAIFGSVGQSDYTAANCYLDAFAQHRRRQGRRTVSIGWTDWLGTGMAFDHGVAKDQGFFRSITVEDALNSFEDILGADCPQVIVGEVNLEMLGGVPAEVLAEQMIRSPLALSSAMQRIISSVRGGGGKPHQPASVRLGDVTVSLAGREDGQYTSTERQIAQIWASELGLSELNVFENSFDLGGDSLMALRIAQTIEQVMGVRVRMAELFRYVTVAELAGHLDGLGAAA